MSIVSVILAPLALLMPGAAAADMAGGPADFPGPGTPAAQMRDAGLAATLQPKARGYDPAEDTAWRLIAESFRGQTHEQVRIEQRLTIRIAPRRAPGSPDLLADLPDREVGPRYRERKIGHCLPVAGIAGVQVTGGNRLLLFLRDRRMVSARLERACRARDFYSGFYLQRNSDGRLCVDRDTLLSRSGANCKLTRIRQLVEVEE